MRYFDEVETLGELKKEFRKLAIVNHPDHGGDARVMRDIICEYQRLVKILPDMELELEKEENTAENAPQPAAPRFSCAYRPTTSGGANPHLIRLAEPFYAHKDICQMAKTLFVYARLEGKEDIKEFYRKLCRLIDPGQWQSYRDYEFNSKVARKSLKLMREKVLNRVFTANLWNLVKISQANLQKAA